MKEYCRKCTKRIRRGLGCLFCRRPICYTCECDCPRVLAIQAEQKIENALVPSQRSERLDSER